MGPLEGLTVVDASWGMPGSVGSLLLADNGANVIKVERPAAGARAAGRKPHTLARLAWERGKKSVELNVNDGADREVLLALLAKADVFIESFGRGRALAFGLGFEQLRERFPRLVCCSLTAYGQFGPWRDEPGYDCLVAAKLGVTSEQPGAGRAGPIFLGHPHIGYGTGFLAAISILAAIRARHVTQRGQLVDVSLLDGLLAQSPMNWWYHPESISYVQTSGGQRTGFGRKRLITAAFECADGEWLQIHTGGLGGFKRTMEIFGFGDITQTVSEGSEMAVPLNDEELVIAREYIPQAFKLKSRHEWIELFRAQDLAALPVLRPGQVLDDEQVKHARRVMKVQHATHGELRQSAPPLMFEKSPLGLPTAAPHVGEHNDEIRAFARAVTPPVTPPGPATQGALTTHVSKPLKHALQGVRILDCASFFATPYGAKILSDLGADVIQIESPGGDQMRPLPNPFEAAQRGKRNIVLNLKTPEAREVVHELVRTADVIMHNQRPGKAEKIGLGYEELASINPRLIYCYLPGYGSSGPKSQLKAFAPLISGFTGLLYEAAGAGNPPARSVEGNEDYYNGLLGAVAVLLGLEHRAQTGQGQYIESPQLHSSLFVTSHHFLGPNNESLSAVPMDSEQTGWGPLCRLYRTSDDWICIACIGGRSFRRLAHVLHLPDSIVSRWAIEEQQAAHADELAVEIAAKLAQMTAAEAKALLREHQVPCEIPAKEPQEPTLFWESWARECGLVVEQPDSMWGPIREIGLYLHLSDTPGEHKGPAPRLGQHTREILRELGHSEERIGELTAKRAVFCDSTSK
jgi:crotonobetainyl-CoA:carnitine CoA-transferase CaiB-like acyl-CoA transferase